MSLLPSPSGSLSDTVPGAYSLLKVPLSSNTGSQVKVTLPVMAVPPFIALRGNRWPPVTPSSRIWSPLSTAMPSMVTLVMVESKVTTGIHSLPKASRGTLHSHMSVRLSCTALCPSK